MGRTNPPDELLEVMAGMPSEWQVSAYRWGDCFDWSAELRHHRRQFALSTERCPAGTIRVVEETFDTGPKPNMTGSAAEVRAFLLSAVIVG